MNISSVVVLLQDDEIKNVIEKVQSITECDVPISEKNKLIVTIEAENIEAETSAMKKIENIEGVISARLVYAYNENELDLERKKVELSKDFPEWLNDETMNAKSIPYSGKLKI